MQEDCTVTLLDYIPRLIVENHFVSRHKKGNILSLELKGDQLGWTLRYWSGRLPAKICSLMVTEIQRQGDTYVINKR